MSNQYGNAQIVKSELKLCIDAHDSQSYSGSGSTFYDVSGNGNNITIPSSPSNPTYNSAGYFSFDGSGERDGNPPGDYLGTGFGSAGGVCSTDQYAIGASYCWWSRITSAQTNGQCILYGSSTIAHVEFKNESTSSPYFRTEAARDNGYSFSGNATIPGGSLVNRWAHFVIAFDNNASPRTVKWYHNGDLFYTKSNFDSGDFTTSEYFYLSYIGRSTGTSSYLYSQSFYGDLGPFQFYGKNLSEAEVKQNFNAQRNRFGI